LPDYARRCLLNFDPKNRATSNETPAKKSQCRDWAEAEDDDTAESTAEVEIDFFLKVGKPDNDDPGKVLHWWKEKACMFPRLARQVLAIPVTSASSERTFGRAGLIITEKRTTISPTKVNILVILNYYLVRLSLQIS